MWSYPAPGDVDVSTDSDYWPALSGSSAANPTLRAGDAGRVELEPNALGGFDLGELEPNTTYTIQHADRTLEVHEVVFTTGQGPSTGKPPEAPVIDSLTTTTSRETPPLCRDILGRLDCFDTGDPTWTQAITTADAKAWVVQIQREPLGTPIVLPSECTPSIFQYGKAPCLRIGAITKAGMSELSEWACEDASRPVPRPDPSAADVEVEQSDAGGCDVAVGGLRRFTLLERAGQGLPLVLVLGVVAALRRRARPSRRRPAASS